MKKPLKDKYLDINNIEVIRISTYEFTIKTINHNQAKYLDNFYQHFYNNPLEFIPFLEEVIVDKEELRKFLKDKRIGLPEEEKIKILVNSICVEVLSIRSKSFDYAFSNAIDNVINRRSIIDQFITVLIGFGYKKIEINNYSNLNIITLALEELFYRDKRDFLEFVSKILVGLNLPLTNEYKGVITTYMSQIKLNEKDPESYNQILKLLNGDSNDVAKPNTPNGYKLKTKSEMDMFKNIPE